MKKKKLKNKKHQQKNAEKQHQNQHKHDQGKHANQKHAEKDIKVPTFKLTDNKEEQPQEKPRIKIEPHKIFGWLLALIMLTILVVVGSMLYMQAFKATSIAKYLPAENTTAFIELNINKEHFQFIRTEKILAKTEYSFEKIKGILSDKLNIDISKTNMLWVGRQVGVAELMSNEKEPTLTTVYFIENTSNEATMNFLKLLAEKNFSELTPVESKDTNIYSFKLRYKGEDRTNDKVYYVGFVDNYLIASETKETLMMILKNQSISGNKIADTDGYEGIDENMPVNSEGFIYINFNKGQDLLFRKYGIESSSPLFAYTIHPFSKFFDAEGAAIIAMDNSFQIQSFMRIDGEFLEGTGDVMSKVNYSAELMQYMPENIDALFGGQNMEKQIKRLSNIMSFGEGTDDFVFKNALKGTVQKYFGSNISLEEDLLPLIENEFVVGVRQAPEKTNYLAVLKMPNTGEGELKMEKLANNFISYGTVFEPEVRETKLPDGTVAKEIIAKSESLIKSKSEYGKQTINELKAEKGDFGLYYTAWNDVGFVATDKQFLIDGLKLLMQESTANFNKSKAYEVNVLPLLKRSDEISYFNIVKYWPGMKLIKSISAGREYSANGIMAYYYIYVQ